MINFSFAKNFEVSESRPFNGVYLYKRISLVGIYLPSKNYIICTREFNIVMEYYNLCIAAKMENKFRTDIEKRPSNI